MALLCRRASIPVLLLLLCHYFNKAAAIRSGRLCLGSVLFCSIFAHGSQVLVPFCRPEAGRICSKKQTVARASSPPFRTTPVVVPLCFLFEIQPPSTGSIIHPPSVWRSNCPRIRQGLRRRSARIHKTETRP